MRTNLIKPKVEQKVNSSVSNYGMLDMVIAFDTTGSMASYISQVKDHVKSLVPKLFKSNPNLRLGIVAFGDYCDMPRKGVFGKAYQVLNLTDNKSKIISFIEDAEDTSGGDWNEFYELVIKKITEETNWREGSNKAVLLIADAMPHSIGYSYHNIIRNNEIDWKEEAMKASKKDIKFDTMTIGSHNNDWYKKLSSMTGGISVPFKSSSKTSQLIEAAALSRGGAATLDEFELSMNTAMAGDDEEMKDIYRVYSKEVTL